MEKREFIKLSLIAGTGLIVSPLISCSSPEVKEEKTTAKKKQGEFTLPALPYAYDALAPSIDAETMQIHHDLHHGGYVRKLNAAIVENPQYAEMELEELLMQVQGKDKGVRNNGGGHYNHSLYWEVLSPGGSHVAPAGPLYDAIQKAFGSQENFERAFFDAAKTRFGSGWAWLSVNDKGELFVSSTANQDNPLMKNIVDKVGQPILGIDVWEHAYYLNYQNKRGDYIKSFMEIINWDVVSDNYNKLA